MEPYERLAFHWGNQLEALDKTLYLPWETEEFLQFLRNCFTTFKEQKLPRNQQLTLYKIIATFFELEEDDFRIMIH